MTLTESFGPSLAPDGAAIAYIVSDGDYPYAVRREILEGGALGPVEPISIPVSGPVTRVLHSPSSEFIACEVAPRGSERTETWVVSPLDPSTQPRRLHVDADVKTTLVEWDGRYLAVDAVMADGVTEARSINPRTSTYRVLDRRTDASLVAAEGGHALMRVGPRGGRELLLVAPDGRWVPLQSPDPGSMTERGIILPESRSGEDELALIVCTDHSGERTRVIRLGINGDGVESTEIIANSDADVEEFVISEDASSAAVLWNQGGISALELLSLDEDLNVHVRRSVELPGLVASDLSITDDGTLVALTVEGPNLPRTVEVLHTDFGQVESLDPERTAQLVQLSQEGNSPELVYYTARDGLELSGWLYMAPDADGPQSVYIHLHGGPENQSRPVHHDILQSLVAAGMTVFTPNIRGSKGHGRSFHHADDRYGRFAAARDVADTATFLIEAGIADPARIAVGGRSYGGYLSLLVGCLAPGMFAAIVDACGMTSFESYFEATEPWLASAAYPEYGYPMQDRELLAQISPLNQVGRLDSPVMFIHGDGDTNVPPSESEQMAEALRDRGLEPVTVVLEGEGHQFVKPSSRRRIAEEMASFFQSFNLLND